MKKFLFLFAISFMISGFLEAEEVITVIEHPSSSTVVTSYDSHGTVFYPGRRVYRSHRPHYRSHHRAYVRHSPGYYSGRYYAPYVESHGRSVTHSIVEEERMVL